MNQVDQSYPDLEGICPSWVDLTVTITPAGAPLIELGDIKSFSSSSALEVGEQRKRGRVFKRTTGSVKHEASMTLYRSGFIKLLDGLALMAPSRGNQKILSVVHFGISLIWTPPETTDIFETRIKGCRYFGDTNAPSEGNDADTVDVALNPLERVHMRNGVEMTLL